MELRRLCQNTLLNVGAGYALAGVFSRDALLFQWTVSGQDSTQKSPRQEVNALDDESQLAVEPVGS